MKITEQGYTNLNRSYYHGFRPDNPQLKSCSSHEFYVTNSFLYAASYSGKIGYVEKYRLKREANILNLQCESDYDTLMNAGIDASGLLGRDWFSYFKGNFEERGEVLKVIRGLGYDGYFNYEIDDELIMHSVAASQYASTVNKKAPSIGVFSKDILRKVETFKDLPSSPEIKKYAGIELEYIEFKLLDLYANNDYDDAHLSVLLDQVRSEVFNFNIMQLYNLFIRFNPRDYIDDYDRLNKKFGKTKLIEDKKRLYYERPVGGHWD